MKGSIIIPTYNEKLNICLLVTKITQVLKKNFEIIIIDDNSPDKTAEKVKIRFKNKQCVRVFVRKKEKSLATAVLFGIKKARGEIIIGMDADFNHPPELLAKLIKETKKFDFVVASRFIKGGGMEDKFRYFFTYLFNLFLKYILGFPTMDNMSGFYAIKKEKINLLPLKKIYRGYGEYHLRLVWYAKKMGFKIKEIPVFYPKRKFGKSKSNLIKMFFNYLLVSLKLKFQLE